MVYYKTEAVILRKRNFGEGDRLYTCLTKRFGKLTLLAKGVRKITSRRAGSLEVLNWSKLSVSNHDGFNSILESETKMPFLPIKNNLYKIGLAYQLIETVDKLTVENQPCKQLFRLFVLSLVNLSAETKRINQKLIVASFQIKALQSLGFYSESRILKFGEREAHIASELLRLPFGVIRRLSYTKQEVKVICGIIQTLVEETVESRLASDKLLKRLEHYCLS